MSNKIGEEREHFEGILSAEEKERFKAWNEMMFRYEDITAYEKFKHGFSLGIMFASELFAEGKADKGMKKKDKDNLLDITASVHTARAFVRETFDMDRLKTLIEKVVVYSGNVMEVVWKVRNPFDSEVSV